MTDLAPPRPGDLPARPGTPLPAGWTIGTCGLGPAPQPRHDTPQHWLTVTLRYDDGHTDRWTHADHYITAAQAQADMRRRMREVGCKATFGPGWMERRHEVGSRDLWRWERLEWTDTDPGLGE